MIYLLEGSTHITKVYYTSLEQVFNHLRSYLITTNDIKHITFDYYYYTITVVVVPYGQVDNEVLTYKVITVNSLDEYLQQHEEVSY